MIASAVEHGLAARDDQTIVRRLNVRGRSVSAAATAARLMTAASLQPSSLPRHAVLIVRRLRDVAPGLLQRGQARRPTASVEWEHAMRQELDDVFARAARPAIEAVGAEAAAVVFANLGELLAAAAQDAVDHSLPLQWWWRAYFGAGSIDLHRVIEHWRRSPRHVPAALIRLAERRRASAFLQRLTAPAILDITRALIASFGVAVPPEDEIVCAPPVRIATPATDPPACEPAVLEEIIAREATPIRHEAAEIARTLPPRAFALFVISIIAHRRPHLLRQTAGAIEALRQTLQVGSDRTTQPPPSPKKRASIEATTPEPAQTSLLWDDTPLWPGTPSNPPPNPMLNAVPPTQHAQPPAAPLAAVRPAVYSIETEFGGLFFLLNFALHLELYADFTTPATPGIELSPWDFVTLLGTELLGRHRDPDDPIWPFLASLAGRADDEPPGRDFHPASECPIPPAWLVEPPIALEDLAKNIARVESDPLRRWLSWITAYARVRLSLALGTATDDELAALLLRHHARVELTPANVDVCFPLAEHPIEIRLAGLDRDPGFIPAAGRSVAFHFE